MLLRQELDELYAGFCETLPRGLQAGARELPYRLRLAVSPGVPWSQVFGHEVTFAAPALFAEAMPQISPTKVRDAVLAHALAVIDGFGTDRIEDRQIVSSPELEEILSRIRSARDRSILSVVGCLGDDATDFARIHREMIEGIHSEQRMMAEHTQVDFDLYEDIALRKTAIGTPASVALARAAGWVPSECKAVAKALSSVWLGMQYHDDVVDWEDDLKRRSSWAVLLANQGGTQAFDPETDRLAIQKLVLDSGILGRMLERSFRHFRAARKRAEALGARELTAWARTKEVHAQSLASQEKNNSGYAVRLHALSPWLAQVLS